jgi:hypothetical protein
VITVVAASEMGAASTVKMEVDIKNSRCSSNGRVASGSRFDSSHFQINYFLKFVSQSHKNGTHIILIRDKLCFESLH